MKYASLQDRIIANTILSTEAFYDSTPCWEWIGRLDGNNRYGRLNIRVAGKHISLPAHRVSLHAFTGFDIASGLVVMHLCNNTRCCAPLHLRSGTQSENIKQCMSEGRHNNFGKSDCTSEPFLLEDFPL